MHRYLLSASALGIDTIWALTGVVVYQFHSENFLGNCSRSDTRVTDQTRSHYHNRFKYSSARASSRFSASASEMPRAPRRVSSLTSKNETDQVYNANIAEFTWE